MENSRVMCEVNPRSSVAEAFRILRTNLQFSTVDHSLKSLLVTSPGPAEGKSTVTANLATVMAEAGVRVILVDCDLRWAEQHRLFDLPNDTGLTDVLVGSVEMSRVLKETRLPNLKVITCGPLPPNPAELLGSEKAREVFSELAESADFILVDGPPTLAVADAAILSSIVDGCVLVIRSGKTKIEAVKKAKERLNKANARIVGTILNDVESSEGYYNYGPSFRKRNRKDLSAGKI